MLAVVCKMYEVTELDLAAVGQGRDISEERAMVAWIVEEFSGENLSTLAKGRPRQIILEGGLGDKPTLRLPVGWRWSVRQC